MFDMIMKNISDVVLGVIKHLMYCTYDGKCRKTGDVYIIRKQKNLHSTFVFDFNLILTSLMDQSDLLFTILDSCSESC